MNFNEKLLLYNFIFLIWGRKTRIGIFQRRKTNLNKLVGQKQQLFLMKKKEKSI